MFSPFFVVEVMWMQYAKLVAEYLFTEREQERVKKQVYKARSKAEVGLRIELEKAYREQHPEPKEHIVKETRYKPTFWDILRGVKQEIIRDLRTNPKWEAWRTSLYRMILTEDIGTLIKNAEDYLTSEAIENIAGDYLVLKNKKDRLEIRLNELHEILKMEFDVDE